ncbi:hypothetical protein VNO80_04480 [Phaseolus coccineus]|uniref:Uncharacterized protein n=1 Tax=Phaseolus coccineus TaxID=3886 RepID=A0AAN9P0W8_PHACN
MNGGLGLTPSGTTTMNPLPTVKGLPASSFVSMMGFSSLLRTEKGNRVACPVGHVPGFCNLHHACAP